MIYQNKIVFIVIFVAVGILIGFLVGQTIQKENTVYISEDSGEKVIRELDLPLNSDTLLNPVFYEWFASVQGIVVEKTENSFTLEKDDLKVVIRISERTRFFRNESGVDQLPLISFDDISIGSEIRGAVTIKKGGLDLIAASFTLLQE